VFHTLFGLSHRRSAVEAVGLYFVLVVIGLLLDWAAGPAVGLLGYDPAPVSSAGLAAFVAVSTATTILRSRRLLASPANVVLWLLAFVGAVYGGLALGLIFPAILSTRPDGPAKRATLTLA
jgi:hypothetical protein